MTNLQCTYRIMHTNVIPQGIMHTEKYKQIQVHTQVTTQNKPLTDLDSALHASLQLMAVRW